MVDYIVVGFGLAGLSFVEKLEQEHKSYVVFEDSSQRASKVAGGLYNPVVLKRFTLAWNADKQIVKALDTYRSIENRLQKSFIVDLPVLRRFNSIEEQNGWFEACDKPLLKPFLATDIESNTNKGLDIPYKYGKVHHTGRIEIGCMLFAYQEYISKKECWFQESFQYDNLEIRDDYISYKGITARNIVFCEGFGLAYNPYFNQLPLVGNKGEYIIIKCPELQLHAAIKSSVFCIPLGNDLYKIGATYNREDHTLVPTEDARQQLELKLKTFIKVPYEVVDQVAGIRPTVKDRRPLVGRHPQYNRLYLLNGLGTRGILIGPSVTDALFDFIEHDKPMDPEIDIRRFE